VSEGHPITKGPPEFGGGTLAGPVKGHDTPQIVLLECLDGVPDPPPTPFSAGTDLGG
jgi:hypothetical protein